jgi:nucleoside 2-deoxyribosyltransferase
LRGGTIRRVKVAKKKRAADERSNTEKKSRVRWPFPRATLEEALKIAYAIKEHNGGNPWESDEVRKAIGAGTGGNAYFYLTAASRDYGLTTGTSTAEKIALADLGRDLVYAPNQEAEKALKLRAFLNVDIFKRVLEYYKGSNLPEMKYLGNTLHKEFDLEPETHEEFSRTFRENCQYLGITSGIPVAPGDESVPTSTIRAPETITLAEAAGASKLTAFVIMPFVERDPKHSTGFFAEVLRSLITPAAKDSQFTVKTANRQGSDLIQSTIINDLIEADLVIADLTEHNPNVMFELGVRMAQDKPVVLIKAHGTGPLFDVDNMLRVFEYNPNLWQTTVEKDMPNLRDFIKGAWDNRESEKSYMKILRGAKTKGTV